MLLESDIQRLDELEYRAKEYDSTSDLYRYVNTYELIDKVQTIINKNPGMYNNTRAKVKIIEKEGGKSTHHLCEVLFHDLEQDLFGTPVIPRLLMWNSYNRECSLSINVGVFRKVCNNGLTMSTDMFSQRAIHIKGREIEQVLKEFEPQVAESIDYIATRMNSDFVGLLGGSLNQWEYRRILDNMIDRKIISLKIRNKILEEVRTNRTRMEDRNPILWSFYNLVNEHIRFGSRSVIRQELRNNKLMEQIILAAA